MKESQPDLKTRLLHLIAKLHQAKKAYQESLKTLGVNTPEYERLEAFIEKYDNIIEELNEFIKPLKF